MTFDDSRERHYNGGVYQCVPNRLGSAVLVSRFEFTDESNM